MGGFLLGGLVMKRITKVLIPFLILLLISHYSEAAKRPKRLEGVVRVFYLYDTENSALMHELGSAFTKKTGIHLDWEGIPGDDEEQLLRRISLGDVGAVLTNDFAVVETLRSKGLLAETIPFMENDLFLVGPKYDPAEVSGKEPADAFKAIAQKKELYLSLVRGGGILKVEEGLWDKAGIDDPENLKGYVSSGRTRLDALFQASDEGAYMLTDPVSFSVFLSSFSRDLESGIIAFMPIKTGLKNRYWVLLPNEQWVGEKDFPKAKAFVDWLTSKPTQKKIEGYQKQAEAFGMASVKKDAGR